MGHPLWPRGWGGCPCFWGLRKLRRLREFSLCKRQGWERGNYPDVFRDYLAFGVWMLYLWLRRRYSHSGLQIRKKCFLLCFPLAYSYLSRRKVVVRALKGVRQSGCRQTMAASRWRFRSLSWSRREMRVSRTSLERSTPLRFSLRYLRAAANLKPRTFTRL